MESGLGAAVELTVSAVAGMELKVVESECPHAKTVAVVAQRWGRYPIRARVDVLARGGLLGGRPRSMPPTSSCFR